MNAAICGAVSVCILRFDNVAVNGNGIADGSDANVGTVINITRAGIYECKLTYPAEAGGTINNIGISMNTNAAALTADPGMATVGIGDFGSVLSPAATNVPTKLSYIATVTKALAAATAVIRFHAGDGANAAPVGGDVIEAEARFSIHLVSNII